MQYNEFKIAMASCFAGLAYHGFEVTDQRYEAICRSFAEDKLKEKNISNLAQARKAPVDCSGPIMKLPADENSMYSLAPPGNP
jgi:hypothetical protein